MWVVHNSRKMVVVPVVHFIFKKTTLMLHCKLFNTHQPILVIFGRDVAEGVCYRLVICYPTSPN